MDFVGIASQDYALQDYMQRVAASKGPVHDRRGLLILEVHLVDPVDLGGGWWESVVIVERTVEVTLIVLLYLLSVLGLLGALNDP